MIFLLSNKSDYILLRYTFWLDSIVHNGHYCEMIGYKSKFGEVYGHRTNQNSLSWGPFL